MENAYLYVVFASTPYKMGRFIRRFTGETYNHVSIALDEGLTQMFSFARRYYRTPFYGGFIKESLSRYHIHGQSADIKVCRIPVSREQHDQLYAQLKNMYANKEHYLYNHLSALFTPIKKLIQVKDACICTQFAAQILLLAGMDTDPARYYSVGDIEKLVESFAIYTGPAPQGDYDDSFYAKKPVPHPVFTTIRNIFALFPRIGK